MGVIILAVALYVIYLIVNEIYGFILRRCRPHIRGLVLEYCTFGCDYAFNGAHYEQNVYLLENKSKYKISLRVHQDGYVIISYLGHSKDYAIFTTEELLKLQAVEV